MGLLNAVVFSNVCMYVGVTGNALPDDIALFIASGANEVVTKPLTKAKLMDAVIRHMTPLLSSRREWDL